MHGSLLGALQSACLSVMRDRDLKVSQAMRGNATALDVQRQLFEWTLDALRTPCLICRSCRFALDSRLKTAYISRKSSSRIWTPWSEASVCPTPSNRSSASTARTWARLLNRNPNCRVGKIETSDRSLAKTCEVARAALSMPLLQVQWILLKAFPRLADEMPKIDDKADVQLQSPLESPSQSVCPEHPKSTTTTATQSSMSNQKGDLCRISSRRWALDLQGSRESMRDSSSDSMRKCRLGRPCAYQCSHTMPQHTAFFRESLRL